MADFRWPTRSPNRISEDNRAELSGWLEERAAELVAQGVEPEVARRRALEEFGDVTGAELYATRQDRSADLRARLRLGIEELISDLRIAARTLARTPTITLVLLLTFGLGLGAPTAIFSVVHAVLLRPLPYGDEGSLVYLERFDRRTQKPVGRHTPLAILALKEQTTSFTGVAGVGPGGHAIAGDQGAEFVTGAEVTVNTLDLLGVRPALGVTMQPGDGAEGSDPADGGVVVLSDALWRRQFGADSGVLGRRVDFSGWSKRVIGVMPPAFRVPTYERAEYLYVRDLEGFRRRYPEAAGKVAMSRAFARLKPGRTVSAAQADVDRVMLALEREHPRVYGGQGTRVVPIRDAVIGTVRPQLLLLMTASGILFLVACANVAGVTLSLAIARSHELSIRVALGAGRRRLVRQLLTEGLAIGIVGASLGLVTAQLGIFALRKMSASVLPAGTSFGVAKEVLGFAIAFALAGALGSSLVPAFAATRVPPVALRREERRSTGSRTNRRLRLVLVAGQLAVTLALLCGGGLLLRTLHRLSSLDRGYEIDNRLAFQVLFPRGKYVTNEAEGAFWASLYTSVRAIRGVELVASGSNPLGGYNPAGLVIEDREADGKVPEVRWSITSDDYFRTLDIPIIRGRGFLSTDREGAPPVCVVSAGLAATFWPGRDPLGARIKLVGWYQSPPWLTIVGVAGDVRLGASDSPAPTVYTFQRQDFLHGGADVLVRTRGDPAIVGRALPDAVRSVDPAIPVRGLQALDHMWRMSPGIANRRLVMQLLVAFALLAVVVAAIGVYGVCAYATGARAREFAIRIALGSPRQRVVWLALQDGIAAVGTGLLLGIPLTLALVFGIRSLLYEVQPLDPIGIAAGLGSLVLVGALASFLPARHVTRIDPASALKAE